MISVFLLDLPELVGGHDAPIFPNLLHGLIDVHSRPILIFDYQILSVFLSLLWVQVHQLFMSVWYIITHDGSLCNKHRREIDNILAQFLAYIGLHPIRKTHRGIISLFIKYLQQCSGVKVVINLKGK